MVVFPKVLAVIARDRAATGGTYRVLLWAWENLSYDQWRQVNQREIATDLSQSVGSVGDGFRYLRERELIERRGAGPRQEWRLTTEGGWMGTAGAYQKRRRETGKTGVRLAVDNDPSTSA
jgi:hypothetical protein